MKILAIESASIIASCAIAEDGIIIGEYTLGHKKTHSEKLMPLIEMLLKDTEIKIQDIDYIAISEGPGSYTGLRIGAAIAKSLSYALNIPLINVPTMKSLAYNIYTNNIEDKETYIVPIMDAKAGRVYAGIYKWVNNNLKTIKEQFPSNIEELINILNEFNVDIIINGDGAENYKEILKEKLKVDAVFSPKNFNYLKASSILSIAYEMAQNKETISSFEFSPKYLRLSQAERNNNQK